MKTQIIGYVNGQFIYGEPTIVAQTERYTITCYGAASYGLKVEGITEEMHHTSETEARRAAEQWTPVVELDADNDGYFLVDTSGEIVAAGLPTSEAIDQACEECGVRVNQSGRIAKLVGAAPTTTGTYDESTNTVRQIKTVTIREIRAALFDVTDQNMTINDLRALLFAIEDQDTPIATWSLGAVINRGQL